MDAAHLRPGGVRCLHASFDVDPIERAEKVFRRSRKVWTSGKRQPLQEKLWKQGDELWRLGSARRRSRLGLALGSVRTRVAAAPAPSGGSRTRMRKRAEETSRASQRLRSVCGSTPDEINGRAVLGSAAAGDLPPRHGSLASRSVGRFVVYDEANLGRHVAVIGQPGSGKTVTLMRLAYLAAKVYGWRVYFLDGKGDHATQREFVATMLDAGLSEQQIGAFPAEPFDGWRTSGGLDDGFAQLLNRLLGVVQFTEPYYEDATRSFLAQALMLEGSLPESSEELLERLEPLDQGLSRGAAPGSDGRAAPLPGILRFVPGKARRFVVVRGQASRICAARRSGSTQGSRQTSGVSLRVVQAFRGTFESAQRTCPA